MSYGRYRHTSMGGSRNARMVANGGAMEVDGGGTVDY